MKAAQRLKKFQTSQPKQQKPPAKIDSANLLDLNQTRPPQHAKTLHGISKASPQSTRTSTDARKTPAAPVAPPTPKQAVAKQSVNTSPGMQRAQQPVATAVAPAPTSPPISRFHKPPKPQTESLPPAQSIASLNSPTPSAAPPVKMQPQTSYPLKQADVAAGMAHTHARNLSTGNAPSQPLERFIDSTSKPRASWWQRLRQRRFFSNAALRGGAVALSMLLLIGYVTYLNYPNIAVRVAANRANIQAGLPGYLPPGYDFRGPIAYSPGQLTIRFSNGSEAISLVQNATHIDSESLLVSYIRQQTSKYDIYRENGLTIYTYDGRHAAWVNGGILYQIESSEFLDPDAIIKMASSL